MARNAKPWFRAADGWWYVCHNGKQTKLARAERNAEGSVTESAKAAAGREAKKAFHRLMAGLPEETKGFTVAEAFDAFLEHSEKNHEGGRTYRWYRYTLSDAARSIGHLAVTALRVHHVTAWMARKKCGDTSTGKQIGAVKTALNYCVKQQLIPENPIRLMEKPPQRTRDRILTSGEWELILSTVRRDDFYELLLAIRECGARPGEIAKLTPANVNMDAGVIVWVRGKTTRKTGKPRVIYMTDALKEIIGRRVAVTGPGDFLFKGRKGNPWNETSFYARFKYLRKVRPELKGVVPYSLRHSFASDALERGIPDATVAELMGHAGTAMLHRHYNHLSKKVNYLKDMAQRAVG